MTDVVAVALISAGSSLLGASVGAFTTFKVSLRNAETTIASAEAQKEVELAKVSAENERLQNSNREEERRNRQSTYHQFLDACTLVFQILGVQVGVEEREEACSNYNHLFSGVVLFGPPSVREGAGEVNKIYRSIWDQLRKQIAENPEKPYVEQWADATADLREEFSKRLTSLVDLMHADVTKGIASDP